MEGEKELNGKGVKQKINNVSAFLWEQLVPTCGLLLQNGREGDINLMSYV